MLRLNAERGLNLLQIEMEQRRYTEGMKYSSIPPTIHCDSFSEEPPINPHGFDVSALTPPRSPSLIGTPQLHPYIGSGISDVPYTEGMKYSSIPPISIHSFSEEQGELLPYNSEPSALTPPRLPSLIGTPQLHHLSPYIGSGISDVPSSQTTSAHFLFTSSYSHLSALQSSPSSSVQPGLNQSSNGFAPINNHVQMSIEQNQDNSGTACTTVTNQITYKEQNSHGHVAPMNNSFFLEKPQKPLVCNFPDCNKRFTYLGSLTRHTKSHWQKVHNLNFGHILYTICKLIQLYEVTI